MQIVFTIGHSTHTLAKFIALIKAHEITAICDVRSQPYSRMNSQFNHATLQTELNKNGIAYIFLGKELGARTEDSACYINGKVQYERLAKTQLFKQGIERVQEEMKSYRIALMCAEKDPLLCHRTLLIARHLQNREIEIKHILEDGNLENQRSAEQRLLRLLKIQVSDLFKTQQEIIAEAYNIQSQKIAYKEQAAEEHQVERLLKQ
jgi:uncharacterized protein (DUF488 family)